MEAPMRKLLLASVLTLLTSTAFAGDSGCGLGSMIISKNSKILQLFSMTTNSYLFTQPLGIISGTSGCSASSIVKNEKEIQYYAESNQEDITREMAQGQGEKLSTLASLYGCEGSKKEVFAQMAQKNYSQIVTSESQSATDLVQNLNSAVVVNKVCPRI